MSRPPRDVADRFWEKVDRRGYDECWPWLGACYRPPSRLLYGRFGLSPPQLGVGYVRTVPAHRAAFYLIHGRWPEPFGLHGCDNPVCCNAENPEHVHEGTHEDNMREMAERGRSAHSGVLPPHPGFGTAHHLAALTDEMVAEIIASRASGELQKSIAVRLRVSEATVSRAVNRLRY